MARVVRARTKKPQITEIFKNSVKGLRSGRKYLAEIERINKERSEELVIAIQSLDPEGVGIVYTDEDEEGKTAVFAQQNSAQEFWDNEAIISWLRKRRTLWMDCSSRILDIQKFESAVARGDIPAAVAKKFKKSGDSPKPFVRFGKPTEKSIR